MCIQVYLAKRDFRYVGPFRCLNRSILYFVYFHTKILQAVMSTKKFCLFYSTSFLSKFIESLCLDLINLMIRKWQSFCIYFRANNFNSGTWASVTLDLPRNGKPSYWHGSCASFIHISSQDRCICMEPSLLHGKPKRARSSCYASRRENPSCTKETERMAYILRACCKEDA